MPRTRTSRSGIKMYTSSNGITALGLKYSKTTKHKSKKNGKKRPKVDETMACEAINYLLSH